MHSTSWVGAPIAAQAEGHLGAILAADVVQASFKAAGVAEDVGLLGEHHRNGVFNAHAIVALHQAGVSEVHPRAGAKDLARRGAPEAPAT